MYNIMVHNIRYRLHRLTYLTKYKTMYFLSCSIVSQLLLSEMSILVFEIMNIKINKTCKIAKNALGNTFTPLEYTSMVYAFQFLLYSLALP